MIPTLLSYAVILIAVPLNWYVTWVLFRMARANPRIRVLHERGVVATALALIVTIFALVFLNNGMAVPILNVEQTQLLTRSAILALSIPPLYWLFLYRNGRQR